MIDIMTTGAAAVEAEARRLEAETIAWQNMVAEAFSPVPIHDHVAPVRMPIVPSHASDHQISKAMNILAKRLNDVIAVVDRLPETVARVEIALAETNARLDQMDRDLQVLALAESVEQDEEDLMQDEIEQIAKSETKRGRSRK